MDLHLPERSLDATVVSSPKVLNLRDLFSSLTPLIKLDSSVWFALGLALVLFVIALKSRANQLSMPRIEPRSPASPDETLPDCMVVIPARNEEKLIARAVKS